MKLTVFWILKKNGNQLFRFKKKITTFQNTPQGLIWVEQKCLCCINSFNYLKLEVKNTCIRYFTYDLFREQFR